MKNYIKWNNSKDEKDFRFKPHSHRMDTSIMLLFPNLWVGGNETNKQLYYKVEYD